VVERVYLFACELRVGEALASDLCHEESEAVGVSQGVVFGSTVLEAEYLLVKVTIKMERFNSDVSPAQRALEQRPEIFDSLCVDLTANVLPRMIHHLMHELISKSIVGDGGICVDLAAGSNIRQNRFLQSFAPDIRNNPCADFASSAVEHSDDGCLTKIDIAAPLLSANLLQFESAASVHLPSVTADKGFVALYRATTSTADFHPLDSSGMGKYCRLKDLHRKNRRTKDLNGPVYRNCQIAIQQHK